MRQVRLCLLVYFGKFTFVPGTDTSREAYFAIIGPCADLVGVSSPKTLDGLGATLKRVKPGFARAAPIQLAPRAAGLLLDLDRCSRIYNVLAAG